jgi:hypothetical protein
MAQSNPQRGEAALSQVQSQVVNTAEVGVGPALSDAWRQWIAENVMLGNESANIVDAMVRNGFLRESAMKEIELASTSSYVRGAERLRNRLKKRDWMLATYRKLNRLRPESRTIERRERLSRVEFFEQYYVLNRPVILTRMIDDWPAMRLWSLEYFESRFGERQVEVQHGRSNDANYEIESSKYTRTMRFADYLQAVRTAGKTNEFYLTANNNMSNKKVLIELWDDIIHIPEYLDDRDPLAGFLWVGPQGTITPFHHDLTNNLLAQVIGRKRILYVPSWDLPLMANLKHVYSTIDGRTLAPNPTPSSNAPQVVECNLEPGEVIFLPIGCWHFVEALTISVSVSFTNFLFDNDFHTFYKTYQSV